MIIKGKFNEAIVYTDKIEDVAVEQIKEILDQEAFRDAKIRIMPDVHTGAGCVIGFTANLGDKVIPNIVGVDIGCGMLTVELGYEEISLEELDNFIHQSIPSGREIYMHKVYDYIDEIENLKCIRELKGSAKEWTRGIGTLGGGNHFIEINVASDGKKYLVIHSGSRNLGHRVASYYQKVAVEYNSGLDECYYAERNRIISSYKQEGKRKEIEPALNELRKNRLVEPKLPPDLCFIEGSKRDEYLFDMRICQEYACLNREVIAKKILEFLFHRTNFEMFHTIHNYIDFEDSIVRKGSIKASLGTKLLIPINMRDGSILAKGLGNEEWNWSAPHGAGRILSRTMAKERISLEDYQKSMTGIYTTSINEQTIDESPMAYKSIDDIIINIQDSVEIIEVLKPIYNFKASN